MSHSVPRDQQRRIASAKVEEKLVATQTYYQRLMCAGDHVQLTMDFDSRLSTQAYPLQQCLLRTFCISAEEINSDVLLHVRDLLTVQNLSLWP